MENRFILSTFTIHFHVSIFLLSSLCSTKATEIKLKTKYNWSENKCKEELGALNECSLNCVLTPKGNVLKQVVNKEMTQKENSKLNSSPFRTYFISIKRTRNEKHCATPHKSIKINHPFRMEAQVYIICLQ